MSKKKYGIISVFAVIIIVLNIVYLYSKKQNSSVPPKIATINYTDYYKKSFISIEVKTGSKKMYLPGSSNILIFGFGSDVYINDIDEYLGKAKIDSFNIKIIAITENKEIFKKYSANKNLKIYFCDDKKLTDFLHLEDFTNFTLMINRDNCIEFYDQYTISRRDLKTLLNKYKRGNR